MSNEMILIQDLIHEIRGKKVMLDFDLARLYQVETRALNQAVQRNLDRFPDDFMFKLENEDFKNLKSQIVISSWGGRRKMPLAFTEQGVAMLSGLLHSKVAVQANIAIMRAFVQVREYLLTTSSFSKELNELRAKVDLLRQQREDDLEAFNDLSEDVREQIDNLYMAIGELSARIEEKKNEPRPRIGFK
ncbi:MAG: ORF6N domain-containing protein [Bacteroidales bacterium]|jgi:hypothetical protein|nr:ORF6N domain-containing protein [Bacteroidales bacterium]